MPISYINSATPLVGTSGTNIAFSATSLTAGNLIVVQIRWGAVSVTVSSVTDTAGNTYVQAGTDQNMVVGGTDFLSLWYAQNTIGNASNIVTINFSSSSSNVYATTAQY